MVGADLSGARVHALVATKAVLADLRAGTLDVSLDGDGSRILSGAEALSFFTAGAPEPPPPPTRRYFGKGDVLRNAALEFHAGSNVVVESHFDNCTIALGERTELVIGEPGLLTNCRVVGPGIILVHGRIFEGEGPSISGPIRLIVSARGAIAATIRQHASKTAFGIEPGARLRVRIQDPNSS